MKTKLSIRSLKTLAISILVAAPLNAGILAQPNPEKDTYNAGYTVRLDNFMNTAEQSVKYIAPDDMSIENEASRALYDLDQFAESVENRLKYQASMEPEVESSHLELLANSLMEQLNYKAPVDDQAYSVANQQVLQPIKNNHRPVKVEVYSSPQDSWLINAGYYKSTRTPAWQKVKRTLNSRTGERNYADGN